MEDDGPSGGGERGRPVVVELVDRADGSTTANVDGRPVVLDFRRVGSILDVIVDGQVVDLAVDGRPPAFSVVASGLRGLVRAEDERSGDHPTGGVREATGAEGLVRSPMPGRVVRVLVTVDDVVAPGGSLLVLEAMKMENEVRARRGGRVVEVHVTAGQAVEASAKLLTLA